ncbi:hypothetical protein [Cellulophaga lytica]|uniref:Uncharacterized protein n=1 Tax=Cellulophaga lytica (strain ATCC 23178 / DSM 7489 / JCM 8516 / NBRC 14961 / NCIMB 1423 / VKM B-1433 / Cy l20) TaxID=867900 RepID=F0RA02_CELLC|nr:hypothetical protein [Cellulophaga lytica]ADY28331.1 hypothetical protein Celly_0496 [Cellulophaga lytica DSM 7489]AIM59397.1 hypothetical protein IX49_02190 [Cellulophaga lytica]WQG77489.1 hypothetical protein SR888_00875 [Cellulophaga lytica]
MNKEQKHIDDFIDKTIQSLEKEKPSVDFTSLVMAKVVVEKTSTATTYKTLISKPVWALIFVIVGGLCVYLSFFGTEESVSWLPNKNYNFLTSLFKNIHLNNSLIYGIVALALMTLIQVPIYKNYYKNKFQV